MAKPASGAEPRAVAARGLDGVLSRGRTLERALDEGGLSELEPRDRSLASALAYGAVRTHLRNRRIIALLVARPFRSRDSVVAALLSVGLHALIESERPDYAVVSATVAATAALGKAPLKNLVNAVLRRFLRERETLLAEVNRDDEARWLHPAWLIDQLRADWPEDWPEILAAGNRQAPMWLRVNLARATRSAWVASLDDTVADSPSGLPAAVLLRSAVPVDDLPGFREGLCSVQDSASQVAALLLNPGPGMRVLDACAAPGGKATHMLEREPQLAGLVALDISAERLRRVAENLQRLGLHAALVAGDAEAPQQWWDGQCFDRILLDAPCSATGVLRRHPDIRFLRESTDIGPLVDRQLRLLQSLWPLLKPGGRLLYSTCSVLRAENEQVVERFIASSAAVAEVPITLPISGSAVPAPSHGQQLLPGRAENDGFYYALMEKAAN